MYEEISQKLIRLIEKGVLRPGDKVPSVRQMSADQRVSVSTVLQSYLQLESGGYIEARPQSGYYVRSDLRPLPPEPDRSWNNPKACGVEVCSTISDVFREARNKEIVPLGAACPSPELFPNTKLHRMMASIARRKGDSINVYSFPPGELPLRKEIARRSLSYGCGFSADEVVITTGAMEAINLSLRAVARPGDTIAVESPTYYGTLQVIESLGMNALEISCTPQRGLCVDNLEKAIREHKIAAVLCSPNFSNPLGTMMPEENKKQLVELLAKHEIPLIEDDVHGDLNFEGHRPSVAKSYDKKGLVLLCSSFSKTLAPGHRVGWVTPGRYQDEIEKLKFINTVATPTLPQLTIAEFLKTGGYDHHLRRLRSLFQNQMQRATQAVVQYFPESTRITRPVGGFVLWVELPKGVDAMALHHRARAAKIGICPGPIFSASGRFRNCIRLSCGVPWSDRLENGLKKLGALVR